MIKFSKIIYKLVNTNKFYFNCKPPKCLNGSELCQVYRDRSNIHIHTYKLYKKERKKKKYISMIVKK